MLVATTFNKGGRGSSGDGGVSGIKGQKNTGKKSGFGKAKSQQTKKATIVASAKYTAIK